MNLFSIPGATIKNLFGGLRGRDGSWPGDPASEPGEPWLAETRGNTHLWLAGWCRSGAGAVRAADAVPRAAAAAAGGRGDEEVNVDPFPALAAGARHLLGRCQVTTSAFCAIEINNI